jgi:predicted DNA-binding transcriptional regulator AlpA
MSSLSHVATATAAVLPPPLPTYLRFADLKAAKLIFSWATLMRLIDREGFPIGRMLGRNTRVWTIDEIESWLAARPTERKVTPRRRRRDQKKVG